MIKCLLFLVSLLWVYQASAQQKMQPALLIDTTGQSTAGFIQYTSASSLAQKIYFSPKATASPSKQTYTPTAIQAFELTELGRKFVRGVVEVDSTTQDTVFLETLYEVEDKKLHYYPTKGGKKRFYIETTELGFKELEEVSTTVKTSTGSYVRKNKKFVGLLKLGLPNCSTLNDAYFEEVSLNIRSLVQVFQDYSQCTGQEVQYQSDYNLQLASLRLNIGVGGSFALTEGFFPAIAQTGNYLEDPQGIWGVPVSVAFNIYPSRIRNTFFVGLGLTYQHKGSFAEVNETKFDLHYLSPYLNVGYQYPYGKIKPFWGVEASSGILLNPNSAFTRTNPFRGEIQYLFYEKGEYNGEATEFALGAFLGVDVPIAKNSLRIEFKYTHGSIPFLNRFYATNYLQVQLAYSFELRK